MKDAFSPLWIVYDVIDCTGENCKKKTYRTGYIPEFVDTYSEYASSNLVAIVRGVVNLLQLVYALIQRRINGLVHSAVDQHFFQST